MGAGVGASVGAGVVAAVGAGVVATGVEVATGVVVTGVVVAGVLEAGVLGAGVLGAGAVVRREANACVNATLPATMSCITPSWKNRRSMPRIMVIQIKS